MGGGWTCGLIKSPTLMLYFFLTTCYHFPMKVKKAGCKIIPSGVYPEKHELDTADFFVDLGKEVIFLKPSRTKGSSNADIIMDGVIWEMKALFGKSKRTVERRLSIGSRQSTNIIIDARHYQQPKRFIINEVSKRFKERRKIKKIQLILDDHNFIDFRR